MALVPFVGASGPIALAEETAAGELYSLVRGAALSAKYNNTVQAVKHILGMVAPYITRENAAAVKAAATRAVDVIRQWGPDAPHALVRSPAVRVSTARQLHRAPSKARGAMNTVEVLPFHDLARHLRSGRMLVGVEPNPGPKQRGVVAARAPAALSTRVVTQTPRISMRNDGSSTRIRHRELLDPSVLGSETFAVQNAVELNPGLASTFPWLAPQALQWEQYVAHSVSLLYIPIAPTNTQGTVTISPSYDPSDPEPEDEQQLSNAVDTVEVTVWQRATIPLKKSSMMTPGPRKFVRGAKVAGDIKTFDAGIVYIATNNCANANPIGKFWIEYDFEFFVPQNSPNVGTAPSKVAYWYTNGGVADLTPANATITKISWDTTTDVQDPLGIEYNPATDMFLLPKGFYRVRVSIQAYMAGTSGTKAEVDLDMSNDSGSHHLMAVTTSNTSTNDCIVTAVGEGYFAASGSDWLSLDMKLTSPTSRTVGSRTVSFEVV